MSDAIIATLITGLITLVGIFISAKSTRDKMTSEIEKQNIIQQQEIKHIKDDIVILKEDIKEHNGYAKIFSETIPVIQEKISVANHRIKTLEDKVNKGGVSND